METREEAIKKELNDPIFPVPILVKKLNEARNTLEYIKGYPAVDLQNQFDDLHGTCVTITEALLEYFTKQIP